MARHQCWRRPRRPRRRRRDGTAPPDGHRHRALRAGRARRAEHRERRDVHPGRAGSRAGASWRGSDAVASSPGSGVAPRLLVAGDRRVAAAPRRAHRARQERRAARDGEPADGCSASCRRPRTGCCPVAAGPGAGRGGPPPVGPRLIGPPLVGPPLVGPRRWPPAARRPVAPRPAGRLVARRMSGSTAPARVRVIAPRSTVRRTAGARGSGPVPGASRPGRPALAAPSGAGTPSPGWAPLFPGAARRRPPAVPLPAPPCPARARRPLPVLWGARPVRPAPARRAPPRHCRRSAGRAGRPHAADAPPALQPKRTGSLRIHPSRRAWREPPCS